jgi:hypothetical protein
MRELQQSAATGPGALDQPKGSSRYALLACKWKNSRQELHAQIQDFDQIGVTADPATLDCYVHPPSKR